MCMHKWTKTILRPPLEVNQRTPGLDCPNRICDAWFLDIPEQEFMLAVFLDGENLLTPK